MTTAHGTTNTISHLAMRSIRKNRKKLSRADDTSIPYCNASGPEIGSMEQTRSAPRTSMNVGTVVKRSTIAAGDTTYAQIFSAVITMPGIGSSDH
jgi:hypothetical protein